MPAPRTARRCAVEAVVCPLVLPKDPKATPGKALAALKQAPAGKFVTVFRRVRDRAGARGGGAFIAYRALWLTSTASGPHQTFSPDAWRAAPPPARYAFWKDLQSRHLLLGRTRSEVEALLGKPTFAAEEYVTYVVKDADPGEFSFNFVCLLQLNLDAAGRVSKAWVRAD